MNLINKEKVKLLNDRLICLATLEYNSLNVLDRMMVKSLSSYIDKYITNFLKKVLDKPDIIDILDKHSNKK